MYSNADEPIEDAFVPVRPKNITFISQVNGDVHVYDAVLPDPSAMYRADTITYLRSIFSTLGVIKSGFNLLSPLLSHDICVTDLYTPLSLNLDVHVEVSDGRIVDFWFETHPVERASKPEVAVRQRNAYPIQKDANLMAVLREYIEKQVQNRAKKYRHSTLEDGIYRWEYIDAELCPLLSQYVVITGQPGSGKSTLLRYIAYCLAGEQLLNLGVKSTVGIASLGLWPVAPLTPIFIELRQLVQSAFPALEDTVTVDKLLEYLVNSHLKPFGIARYISEIRSILISGRAVIFLDGLDEVPFAAEAQRREQLKHLVRLIETQYPECRIVVTSRSYAYAGDWRLDGFENISLACIQDSELEGWAENIFHNEIDLAHHSQLVHSFVAQVKTLPTEIRSNPLLFNLIAAVWLYRRTRENPVFFLPNSHAEIYRECISMLLRLWSQRPSDTESSMLERMGLTPPEMLKVLEYLAFRVQNLIGEPDKGGFESGLIMTVIRHLELKGVNYDEFLIALAQRAGLVYEKAPDIFQFVHRTFQEFLAAGYLASDGVYPDTAAKALKSIPLLWRNVCTYIADEIRFRNQDIWDLISSLLPTDGQVLPNDREAPFWETALLVAHLMTEEADPQDKRFPFYVPYLRHILTALVSNGALSPRERAEAGRILAECEDLRLGIGINLDGIPEIAWVDIDCSDGNPTIPSRYRMSKFPITVVQYQAFLNASDGHKNERWWLGLARGKGTPYSPHWNFPNHPREKVSWYDAVAFCRWLSMRLTYQVRLPTIEEWRWASCGPCNALYSYGDDFDADKGNTGETRIGMTTSVGLFPRGATALGVMDMSGNVWEWTLSPFSTASFTEGFGINKDLRRYVCGGSRSSDRQDASGKSCSNRYASCRSSDLGFRIVATEEISIEQHLQCSEPLQSTTVEQTYCVPVVPFIREDVIVCRDPKVFPHNKVIFSHSGQRFTAQELAPTGDQIALGSSTGEVFLLPLSELTSMKPTLVHQHNFRVRAVRLHPTQPLIASCSDGGDILLTDTRRKKTILVGRHNGTIYDVVFDPANPDDLFSAGEDGSVRTWSVSTALSHGTLVAHDEYYCGGDPVRALAFDRNGQRLASAVIDSYVYLRNIAQAQTERLGGHEGYPCCISFHPHMDTVMAGGEDATVRLWHLDTKVRLTIEGHQDMVWAVAFDHSGNRIISASKDQTIRVVDLPSRQCWSLEAHEDYVYSLNLHPKRNCLFSVGGDGVVREWDIDLMCENGSKLHG